MQTTVRDCNASISRIPVPAPDRSWSGRTPAAQVILTGGQLNYRTGLLEGSALRRSLENYQADIGFSSAFGLNEEGLLDISDECSDQIALMLGKSAVRVVLADHTKFGRKSFCRCLPWSKIHVLVTVFDPENHEFYKAIREKGVKIIFADK